MANKVSDLELLEISQNFVLDNSVADTNRKITEKL